MIEISTPVFPTENEDIILSSVMKIFPDAQLKRSEDVLTGTSGSLDMFIELLTRQRIRDSARDHILKHRIENTSIFLLNKQTATRGRISFSEENESSLGDIQVKLTLEDWDPIIEKLSPPNRFAPEDQSQITS